MKNFLKKIKVGQKVYIAWSKSNEIIDQEINHFEETENQIYFKINKEKYRFSKSLFNIYLRQNTYLVLNDLFTKRTKKGYELLFFSKKDFDHFLANKTFYIAKEHLKIARDKFIQAKLFLEDAKNNLTN
jgi:hypothetical protein